MLSNFIVESNAQETLIKRIVDDLNTNYEPTKGTYKKGGEYFEEPMISNKVSDEMVTAKALLDYMCYKYKVNDEFIKQVISDWYNGSISDSYTLSKNVAL